MLIRECSPPTAAALTVIGITGIAVAVVVDSLAIVGGTTDVVPVKVEVAPMVPPLIRRAPRAEAAVRCAGRVTGAGCCERGDRPLGHASQTSRDQSRPRLYCVSRDDPHRERCFRLAVSPLGKLDIAVV